MKNRLKTLQVLTSMFQELLAPLISLLASHDLLKGNVPTEIISPLGTIGETGRKLKSEVHYLYLNVEHEFDLNVSRNTLSKINMCIVQWKKYETILSEAFQQIRNIREAGLRLSDPKLDKVLGEIMFNAFDEFKRLLHHVGTLEENDLFPHDHI